MLPDLVQRCIYLVRRNGWMLDPSWFGHSWEDTPIDRPVFLLGVQGGGLTLLSRMLRRSPCAVSATGDHTYWSGADELQNVFGPLLPASLTGLRHKAPRDVAAPEPRGWVYATDRLLAHYRNSAADASPDVAARFQRVLRWAIHRSARGRPARLVDKSQVFTVKVSYVEALLRGCQPIFLLVTRNPYALCQRAAEGILPRQIPFAQRLTLAAQHWRNSMAAALDDAPHVGRFHVVRFEDVLSDTAAAVHTLCAAAEIPYDPALLPGPGDRLPVGSRRHDRWYPVRADANLGYLQRLSRAHADLVQGVLGDVAQRLGYDPPAD